MSAPKLIRMKQPVARKQHTCSVCNRKIETGEKYERKTFVGDSKPYDVICHIKCPESRKPAQSSTITPPVAVDLSRMTPAQQKRFADLMMRDFRMNSSSAFDKRPAMPFPLPPTHQPQSVDDFLNRIENTQNRRILRAEQQRRDSIDKALTRDELFRFAYVPFVIAELVWDYADTVLDMAHRIPEVKKLSRAIRNARAEYDALRRQYINAESREREIENMYVFEDGVKRITKQMLVNIDIDIKSEYPELIPESRDLLVAVYQCHVLSRALVTYTDNESRKLERKLKHQRVGRILPPPYYVMDKLIPEFVGDKPASAHLKNLFGQYIKSLSVQIGLIALNDESGDDNASNYHFSKPNKQ